MLLEARTENLDPGSPADMARIPPFQDDDY